MKKILYFITQSEFGGTQRYVFDLAVNLKSDYEVAIAMGWQENNGILAKILTENNIKHYIIPHLKRSISPINEFLALREIIKLIKQFQPDIIHLNSSKISILGSIAALFTNSKIAFVPSSVRLSSPKSGRGENRKSKIVYTVHGWVFNEPLPAWLKYFYLCAEKFTARFKDKIICVSEYDRQTALRHKIAPAEKLVTIHNGLSPIELYDKQRARELLFTKIENRKLLSSRAQAEGKIENILVGSIGHLYKTKGFEYFIQTASILMADPSFPHRWESRFIIIGDGSERKSLENVITKYNLQNNFIMAGQIDEAAKLLPAFDIYVNSSVKEGFPYSVLEAMSAGLPIVSANVGGLPEMIDDQKTGLLSKPADAQELAKNIKLLIGDKTLQQKLGARAREKVKTEFSLEKMIAETNKLYR